MDVINSGGKVPLVDNKLGSDCSGTDADLNRTISTDNEIEGAIAIGINGAWAHEGAGLDFTRSGNTITFLNAIDDTAKISIVY